MKQLTGNFMRDASNRLCFEIVELAADDFANVVARIVQHFQLKPNAAPVIGPDQLVHSYSDGECSIGLDWDNWSGFFVTAHSPESESLVSSVATFLLAELALQMRPKR